MKNEKSPWPMWMGIYGFRFVYHGEWSDPEIIWHGHIMNVHHIEDPMWADFKNAAMEYGLEVNEDNFVKYCKEEKGLMREYAQMAIDGGRTRTLPRN